MSKINQQAEKNKKQAYCLMWYRKTRGSIFWCDFHSLIIIYHFIGKAETQFLKNIYKILPAEFVAFPMVGVDCLVSPKGDKVLYNTILSQYVDVCIFLKDSMQPVLAIDLFEPSPIEQQMKQLHPNVKKALSTVGIPLMTYQLSEGYSIVELRSKIIDAMPPKIVAMLKDKVKNDNSGL